MNNPSKLSSPSVSLETVSAGLENIVAAQTVLSHVDGAAGRLVVRGYDLDTLADRSFEAVLALLWQGFTSGPHDEADISRSIGSGAAAGI